MASTKKEAETVEQGFSMAEVKAQVAAMLAEAKKEADRMLTITTAEVTKYLKQE